MSSGRSAEFVFLVALVLVLAQPAIASGVPTPGGMALQSLCFCQSGASKPSHDGGFGTLDASSLLVVAGAAFVASIMGLLLVRLMRKGAEAPDPHR